MISIEMIDQTIDSHYEEKVGGFQGWPTVARVKPLEFTITKCLPTFPRGLQRSALNERLEMPHRLPHVSTRREISRRSSVGSKKGNIFFLLLTMLAYFCSRGNQRTSNRANRSTSPLNNGIMCVIWSSSPLTRLPT
ncbi:hypothetical protein K456DRAFT_1603017 [Colletotrichum gloeosporioides 23]|nr:hypothetical protein K456DRAFT_1603017 [Colletotrichum gloeosporioides 23]